MSVPRVQAPQMKLKFSPDLVIRPEWAWVEGGHIDIEASSRVSVQGISGSKLDQIMILSQKFLLGNLQGAEGFGE